MKVKLVESNLIGSYAVVADDDGNEERYDLTKGEAVIIGCLIALQTEVDELAEKLK